jgi:hypothetical protein
VKKMLVLAALATTVSAPAFADGPIQTALKERQGKTATVVLEGGNELTGTVSKIEDGAVRLTELSGKEYYDAIVDLDDVAAVVIRVRSQ